MVKYTSSYLSQILKIKKRKFNWSSTASNYNFEILPTLSPSSHTFIAISIHLFAIQLQHTVDLLTTN